MEPLLRVAHALIGAGWLGSIYFSLTVLHPQGPALFTTEEAFEEFVAGLSDGNRWRVLSAFTGTLVTGVALVWMRAGADPGGVWWALIATKLGLWCAAAATFYYVSWRLWAARVFALPSEYAWFRRRGTQARAGMLVLVGANLACGVLAHAW
jgi:hypothetical protein